MFGFILEGGWTYFTIFEIFSLSGVSKEARFVGI